MTEEDWDALPTETVPLAQCVFMLNDMHVDHIWPDNKTTVAHGPIRLALLSNGMYLIRDGRHRVVRAQLAGYETIQARVSRYE